MIGFGVWFAFGKGRSFFNSMEEKEKNDLSLNKTKKIIKKLLGKKRMSLG